MKRFPDPAVQKSIEVALALIGHYNCRITDSERYLIKTAKAHDAQTIYRLRSNPGGGKILALVLLYEIHDIQRLPHVQQFVPYSRLVKCGEDSAGQRYSTSSKKIGNAYLK